MTIDNMSGVLKVEQASFDDPWSEDAWRAELAYNESICLVAIGNSSTVQGMLALRRTLDEGHIMRLAVLPELRRKGIATSLLRTGLRALRSAGCRQVYLELRISNRTAASFYEKHGFRRIGKRKAYYGSPPEDAAVMCLSL